MGGRRFGGKRIPNPWEKTEEENVAGEGGRRGGPSPTQYVQQKKKEHLEIEKNPYCSRVSSDKPPGRRSIHDASGETWKGPVNTGST